MTDSRIHLMSERTPEPPGTIVSSIADFADALPKIAEMAGQIEEASDGDRS